MRVRIFQPQCYGVRRCVARGLCRSRFHSIRQKISIVTWCLAKTSYPTSRWDVAVTNGHCSRTVLPLTPPETQKLAAWEPAVHFVHRIARIWTWLTCHLGWSSADGLPSSNFAPQLTKLREQLSKAWHKLPHGAVIANSSLLSPFYLRLMLFARWHHYFPRLIQINYCTMFRMKRPWFMPNLVTICSIFLKLEAVKQSGPGFLAYPVYNICALVYLTIYLSFPLWVVIPCVWLVRENQNDVTIER